MNRTVKWIMVLSLVLSTLACEATGKKEESKTDTSANPYQGLVLSVTPATKYIILEIEGPNGKFWAAAAQKDVKPGQTVRLVHAYPMQDFEVKSLNRTFDEIYFAQDVVVAGEEGKTADVAPHGSETPHAEANPHAGMDGAAHMAATGELDGAGVTPLDGQPAIAQLLDHPENYAGKTVTVRGRVVKLLANIMGSNWVHLKDESSKERHLVVTTKDQNVNVGDTAVFEGAVVTDKDFGYGYKYAILIENARLVK